MKLTSHYKESVRTGTPQIINWRENDLGDSLYYSYRATHYDRSTFPSRLHCHDYFELVFFEEGDIQYICESEIYRPQAGDVLLISPGMFHMSAICCDKTLYKRHVFYLYPDALDAFGCGVLTTFLQMQRNGLAVFRLEEAARSELFSLLRRLDNALEATEDPMCGALAIGLVIQIFFLLNSDQLPATEQCAPLPQTLAEIKAYIDENFRTISSANQVAAHFFYSREYVSRLFRKHFNTTVCEYIKARRISYCQRLLEQGCSISDACYRSGFDNMSTFIRAFHGTVGMTPSAYRKSHILAKNRGCSI